MHHRASPTHTTDKSSVNVGQGQGAKERISEEGDGRKREGTTRRAREDDDMEQREKFRGEKRATYENDMRAIGATKSSLNTRSDEQRDGVAPKATPYTNTSLTPAVTGRKKLVEGSGRLRQEVNADAVVT
ncbi:hypothetical protein EXIGLDRAFT_784672 [Exidia glandulosa HHB12029]|uniref:Uncharacterized protein n=1 Tax=Exidia glandulosa HHB12029 TaxID=1314781 RepID=A0A166MBT5_EXIGL|nr:hypothetical protein EXIGLDRAFT_784672 [Exidia glandulosa HHB12029]